MTITFNLKFYVITSALFVSWSMAVAHLCWTIGFKDGWLLYHIDSVAVQMFHEQADQLENDSDPIALDNEWKKCVDHADKFIADWDDFTLLEKYRYPTTPFWKSNKGMPRRISKKQKEQFLEQFKQQPLAKGTILRAVQTTTTRKRNNS